MKIGYNNKLIPNALSTKFLGLTTDNTLTMKNTYRSSNKLNSALLAM